MTFQINFRTDWRRTKPKLETGAKIDITVTPKISLKVPTTPTRFKKGAKLPFLSILDNLGERNQFHILSAMIG